MAAACPATHAESEQAASPLSLCRRYFCFFSLLPISVILKLDFRLRFSFSGFSWGGLSLPMWCVFARTQNIKGGPGSEAMVASSGVAKVFIASQPQNRERTS